MKKLLTTVALAGMLVLAGGTIAVAGGSDAPTPYTVDTTGITLPQGDTFPAHGHVNLKTSQGPKHIHFDPNNNHPGGQWIGKSHIPWSAFGLTPDFCVTWVQMAEYNEHFGEGGQEPVCVEKPKPTPTYFLETSHSQQCGVVTVNLRNNSPWLYRVLIEVQNSDGAWVRAGADATADVMAAPGVLEVDNRNREAKDYTGHYTVQFEEDAEITHLRYRVSSGTESDLYKNLPVGTFTTIEVATDCLPPAGEPPVEEPPTEEPPVTPQPPTRIETASSGSDNGEAWASYALAGAIILGGAVVFLARRFSKTN